MTRKEEMAMSEVTSIGQAISTQYQESKFNGYTQDRKPKKVELATYKSPDWSWQVDIPASFEKAKFDNLSGELGTLPKLTAPFFSIELGNLYLQQQGESLSKFIRTTEITVVNGMIDIIYNLFKETDTRNKTWAEAKRMIYHEELKGIKDGEEIEDKSNPKGFYYLFKLDERNYYKSVFGRQEDRKDLKGWLNTIHHHPSKIIRFKKPKGREEHKYQQTICVSTQIIVPILPLY